MSKMANLVRILLASLCALLAASAWAGYDWKDRIQLRGEGFAPGSRYYGGGDFVQRADGKMLITYQIDNWLMLSVVDTEQELLTVPNASATNEWKFYQYYSLPYSNCFATLQKLRNGRILLYVMEWGADQWQTPTQPLTVVVFESKNGLGTDFVKVSDMLAQDIPTNFFIFGARAIGKAIEIKNKILVPITLPVRTSPDPRNNVLSSVVFCAVSTDGGKTWKFDQVSDYSWWRDPTKGFGLVDGVVITLGQDYYGGGITTIYSMPADQINGQMSKPNYAAPTWKQGDTFIRKSIGDMLVSHFFYSTDGNNYFLYQNPELIDYSVYGVYSHPSRTPIDLTGQAPYSVGSRRSGATWYGPLNSSTNIGDDGTEIMSVTPSGHLAVYGRSYYGGQSTVQLTVGFKNPR